MEYRNQFITRILAAILFLTCLTVSSFGAPKDSLLAKCNDIQECDRLGRKGLDSQDYGSAAPFFIKSCTLGGSGSCNDAGLALKMLGHSSAEFLPYYEKACTKQSWIGCYNAGKEYFERKAYRKAERLLSAACRHDDSYSCTVLGASYHTQGKHASSLKYNLRGCELGDPTGCFNAGLDYRDKNQAKKALFYFKIACTRRLAVACLNLSDYEERFSKKWTAFNQKACNAGDFLGCNNVGMSLAIAGNKERALGYYRLACEHGISLGCFNAAAKLEENGNLKDAKNFRLQAAKLAKKRCDEGRVDDCNLQKELNGRNLAENTLGEGSVVSANGAVSATSGVAASTQQALFRKLKPAIAVIEIELLNVRSSLGTGFFISHDGLLITNYHVLRKAFDFGYPLKIRLFNGTILHDVRILKCRDEREIDLCLLQIKTKPEAWFDSPAQAMEIGEQIFTIGHPLGFEYSMTSGILSGVRTQKSTTNNKGDSVEMIQMSVPISAGNSGGPVFDSGGQLLGMATMTVDPVRSQNLNFAISAGEIFRYKDQTFLPQDLSTYRNTLAMKRKENAEVLNKTVALPILRSINEGATRTQVVEESVALGTEEYLVGVPAAIALQCFRRSRSAVACIQADANGFLEFRVATKQNTLLDKIKAKKLRELPINPLMYAMQDPVKKKALDGIPQSKKAVYFSKISYLGCKIFKPNSSFPKGWELCTIEIKNDIEQGLSTKQFYLTGLGSNTVLTISSNGPEEFEKYFGNLALVAISTVHRKDNTYRKLASTPLQ